MWVGLGRMGVGGGGEGSEGCLRVRLEVSTRCENK